MCKILIVKLALLCQSSLLFSVAILVYQLVGRVALLPGRQAHSPRASLMDDRHRCFRNLRSFSSSGTIIASCFNVLCSTT